MINISAASPRYPLRRVFNRQSGGGPALPIEYIGAAKELTWWNPAYAQVSVPAGTQTGDLLVAFFQMYNPNAGGYITNPNGDTVWSEHIDAEPNNSRFIVATGVVGATVPTVVRAYRNGEATMTDRTGLGLAVYRNAQYAAHHAAFGDSNANASTTVTDLVATDRVVTFNGAATYCRTSLLTPGTQVIEGNAGSQHGNFLMKQFDEVVGSQLVQGKTSGYGVGQMTAAVRLSEIA